uniref:Uncharacterized protein n=1 Tax=Cacopsylla melanoneura TaxID=428564 RepID=A0A8D8ZFF2_9HEMI
MEREREGGRNSEIERTEGGRMGGKKEMRRRKLLEERERALRTSEMGEREKGKRRSLEEEGEGLKKVCNMFHCSREISEISSVSNFLTQRGKKRKNGMGKGKV